MINSTLTITACELTGNSTEAWDVGGDGGAIYASETDVTITDCDFVENETLGYQHGGKGPAIYLLGCVNAVISESRFFDNASTGEQAYGGAIIYDASLTSQLAFPVPGVAYWTKVTLPNGMTLPQPIQFVPFTLPPFADIFAPNMQFQVPPFAPEGTYTYTGNVGFYPGFVAVTDSFPFTKSAAGGATAAVSASDFAVSKNWPGAAGGAAGETGAARPGEVHVSDPYPNPFNAATSITVSVPEAAELTIEVTNVAGRRVATLHRRPVEPGAHTFSFDASGRASGLYFLRVSTPGGVNLVRRALLVR